jgi:glycine cleavage system aminomethyltransferase T
VRFLTPTPDLPALSPLYTELEALGSDFEERGGWLVATRVPGERPGAPVVWTDMSHLPKFEVHDGQPDGRGRWCQLTPRRALVLGAQAAGGLDVTTQYGAMLLTGPEARETIARFCAIDLRPQVAPPGAFRPGSVARVPGAILVEAPDRFLLLFGSALATYVWTVVSDAGARLGGSAVGVDAVREEALTGA